MYTCNTGSSSLFKYHKKGEFECYESCDLFVGIIRKMYIINGYECDCVLYANEIMSEFVIIMKKNAFIEQININIKINVCWVMRLIANLNLKEKVIIIIYKSAFLQKKNAQTIIIIFLTKILAGLHDQLESLPML